MTIITVKKDEKNPESKEVLAAAIIRIGESFQRLSNSGMNEKGIIVLISDDTKLGKGTIKLVLDSLRRLSSWYCK